MINVLLLGSGGREHALAHSISKSPQLEQLYIAPGNPGTSTLGKNLDINPTDFVRIKEAVDLYGIDLLIVGPEAPLVDGIVDYFEDQKLQKPLRIIGPSAQGALLEGSKDYAKQFMSKHGIPTARYQSFTKETIEEAFAFIDQLPSPYVLKADGLAAGKGVLIIDDQQEAKEELKSMLIDEKFGQASTTVVIEEFLNGIEMSVFVLTDGRDYHILPTAKDYKRIGHGDTGLNTGGMGAISPVPFASKELMQKIENEVVQPTIDGLKQDDIDYKGFVFIGLMIVKDTPYVIEYNVRMGDPETEVVLPRITSDLLQHLDAVGTGQLAQENILITPETAVTVMCVSGGYPEAYEKGKVIHGLDQIKGSTVYQAGTKVNEKGQLVTNGGRVMAVTSYGNDHHEALKKSYHNIAQLSFDRMYYREDIGFDL